MPVKSQDVVKFEDRDSKKVGLSAESCACEEFFRDGPNQIVSRFFIFGGINDLGCVFPRRRLRRLAINPRMRCGLLYASQECGFKGGFTAFQFSTQAFWWVNVENLSKIHFLEQF